MSGSDDVGAIPVKRLEAVVSGRVQGVFFRQTTLREARALDLTGWVRYEPGGTVRVVAEGKALALESLLTYLHSGPPQARVSHVDEVWLDARGEFTAFTARY